jgi:hypothetical protein
MLSEERERETDDEVLENFLSGFFISSFKDYGWTLS